MQNNKHIFNGAQLTCLRETVSSLKALTIKTNRGLLPATATIDQFKQNIELKILGLNA